MYIDGFGDGPTGQFNKEKNGCQQNHSLLGASVFLLKTDGYEIYSLNDPNVNE